ncbi:52 kDa repressor of the inhibitor of the protein kinase-like 4, partial [Homarus americanus]
CRVVFLNRFTFAATSWLLFSLVLDGAANQYLTWRHLASFVELHPTVVACLEKIVEGGPAIWSTVSLTDAQTLLLAITSTGFIVSLVITNNALGYLKGVTTSLQAEAKDIVEASSEVNYLKAALQDVRNNMDDHYTVWFCQAEQLCEAVGITPSMPRRCKRQQHRDNMSADGPAEYYKRTVAIPLLDHLLAQLEKRFTHLYQKPSRDSALSHPSWQL